MPREKKDYRNFGCKLDTTTFNRLNDFCEMSGQNKTFVVERAIQMFLNENCSISKAGETARVEIKLGDKWCSMMIPCAAFEPNHLTNMDMSWKGKLWCDFGKTKLIKDGKLQRDNLARLKIEIEYPNEKYLSELEMFHKKYGDTIKQAEELEKKLRG